MDTKDVQCEGYNMEESDMQYIAEQLSELCTEYVNISDELEEIQKGRKSLVTRQKELSTRITSLMGCSDIDEVNCGTKHKIIKTDRKSTTSLKINDIENIVGSSKFNISNDLKEQIFKDIKETRVTTLKPSLKVKKLVM